jgi:SAM-dependent methyltransferase
VRLASPRGSYACASSDRLPFRAASFDGVLLNEVLEHVDDEWATLRECLRVVRPGGHLALISPNRWFPFEGHGAVFGPWTLDAPAPLVPWLPRALGHRFMRARNYWPHELLDIVSDCGFVPVHTEGVLPVFETFPWLPESMIRRYRRALPRLDRSPAARLGVSTLVLARRPVRREVVPV